jgi:hypothetical protein
VSEQAYQAVGVLAGRLDGDRIVLLDGEAFAATPSPVLRQWIEKHPDEAAAVRLWLAYPRTMKPADGGLAFLLVGTPDDQTDPRWGREIDRFTIKGQCMDTRSTKNFSVIRIPRNQPAPRGQRRERNWLPHLLFLNRALTPVKRWKATDVWIEAKREGRQLYIASYRPLHHHPTTISLPVGTTVPWPLRPARSTVSAVLKSLLPPNHTPLGVTTEVGAAETLAWLRKRTSQFNALHQAVAATLEPAAAAADNEALSKEDIASDVENAHKWSRFFDRVLTFLEGMEPGQLVALCKTIDPLLAIDRTLTRQIDAWFQLSNPTGHRLRFTYAGKPVPRSVAKTLLAFYKVDADTPIAPFAEPVNPTAFFRSTAWLAPRLPAPPQTEVPAAAARAAAVAGEPVGLAEMGVADDQPVPIAVARQWLEDVLGIPERFSNQEAMAALIRLLEEDGYTPLQIKMRLGLLPSQLAQFKRVELPEQF